VERIITVGYGYGTDILYAICFIGFNFKQRATTKTAHDDKAQNHQR